MPRNRTISRAARTGPLLDPETHLNKNATFDTFVPGDSNRFARTVALAVAEGSGMISIRCVSTEAPAWAKPIC